MQLTPVTPNNCGLSHQTKDGTTFAYTNQDNFDILNSAFLHKG
jgi:hypothetical protein